ncbi:MAG: hypothetical protein FJ042_06855 [Candidatus Cloacimonetes bacterium]|nr:hypothetical protein [Candidatus Cloacimonadota bacterium]
MSSNNLRNNELESTPTFGTQHSPNPAALESMHMHIGTTTLEFKENSKEIVGSYYSGRDRKNVGDITINRTK